MRFTVDRILGIAPAIALGLLFTPAPGIAQTPRPDLVMSALAPPPADALPGDSFVVTSTVANLGPGIAGASVTKFFLVPASGPPKNLKGVQNVDQLAAGASATPPVTVAVYSDTLPGTYTMSACVNRGDTKVPEVTDANNCRTASGTITVHEPPNLALTVMSEPPSSVGQGLAFPSPTTFKVKNNSPIPAAATTMKFYLVSTTSLTRIDLKGVTADLAVPALNPQGLAGAIFTHSVLLRARAETVPGLYRMVGCADSGKVVTETDEIDNCLLSAGTVQVTPEPDLTVNNVTVMNAVLTVQQGDPLTISAVVKNKGSQDAGASTMTFRLVPPSGTPTKNLKGTPAVPAVPQGMKTMVNATVHVYDETVPGTYTVLACVDSQKQVPESSDGNNCTPAPTQLTVTGIPLSPADLAVDSLSEPPASAFPGDTLQLTAAIKNLGTGPSEPTSTTFYLVDDAGVRVKNLKGVQAVPAVGKGATVNPTAVAIALYSDTAPGSFFLMACADGLKALNEVNEDNNCKPSTGKITVKEVPDLTMTSIGNPPSTIVAGQSLPAPTAYSVTNTGAVAVATKSTAKFYLVSTAVDAARFNLKGEDEIPALGVGIAGVFNGSVQLKVGATTPSGTYKMQGCADSGKVVAESDEEDNCMPSANTVQVTGLPDLIVNAVRLAAPSVTVARGGTLPITAVVRNQGFADAPSSTIKLSLVVTPGAAPTKTLPEAPVVPAIAKDTKQSVQATVTVPSTTPVGTYVLQGCVDSAKLVPESTDENNCATSVGTITVTLQ